MTSFLWTSEWTEELTIMLLGPSCASTNWCSFFSLRYMASIEKQLLGTETILEMRALGFEGRLFGLSANDLEAEFIAAGADGFVIKPFPTETDALKHELLRAYFGKRAYYAPP